MGTSVILRSTRKPLDRGDWLWNVVDCPGTQPQQTVRHHEKGTTLPALRGGIFSVPAVQLQAGGSTLVSAGGDDEYAATSAAVGAAGDGFAADYGVADTRVASSRASFAPTCVLFYDGVWRCMPAGGIAAGVSALWDAYLGVVLYDTDGGKLGRP